MGKATGAKRRNSNFVYATKEELTKTYTDQDYIAFIESQIKTPSGTRRKNFYRISDSYWRVTYWTKSDPKNTMSGDRILFSKFIRIDLDSIGRMNYNDVTDGKRL